VRLIEDPGNANESFETPHLDEMEMAIFGLPSSIKSLKRILTHKHYTFILLQLFYYLFYKNNDICYILNIVS